MRLEPVTRALFAAIRIRDPFHDIQHTGPMIRQRNQHQPEKQRRDERGKDGAPASPGDTPASPQAAESPGALAVLTSAARAGGGAFAYSRVAVATGATGNAIGGHSAVQQAHSLAQFSFSCHASEGVTEPAPHAPVSDADAVFDLRTGTGRDNLTIQLTTTDDGYLLAPRTEAQIHTGGGGDTVSMTASGSAGRFVLDTGDGDDVVSVSSGNALGTVRTGDGNDSVNATSAGTFRTDLGSGNDVLTINATGNSSGDLYLTADGGDGADTMTITARSNGGFTSQVGVSGGGGDDVITATIDNAGSRPTNYSIGSGSGDDTITLTLVSTAGQVWSGDGNDTITLIGTSDAIINGGLGQDRIDLRQLRGSAHIVELENDVVQANADLDMRFDRVVGASVIEFSAGSGNADPHYTFEYLRREDVTVTRQGNDVSVKAKWGSANLTFRNVASDFESRLQFAPQPPPPTISGSGSGSGKTAVAAPQAILATQVTVVAGKVAASAATMVGVPADSSAATISAVRLVRGSSGVSTTAATATRIDGSDGQKLLTMTSQLHAHSINIKA